MIKEKIKRILYKHAPNSLNYITVIKRFIKRLLRNLKVLSIEWQHIHVLKKAKYFDSSNLTYDNIISLTFQECFLKLKSSNILYLGEIKIGSHRFLVLEKEMETIEYQLIELLNLGYLIDIHKNGNTTRTISHNINSINKLKSKIKNFDLLRIYKIYKNESGIIEFESKTAFEIERWYKVNDIYTTNAKNRIQNKLTNEDLNRTIETEIFRYKVKQIHEMYLHFKSIQSCSANNIDLVYTWVDGNDPRWFEKKSKYLNDDTAQKVHHSSISINRFLSRDELKYSLRSVEKYFSGYRKIYIVTDGQKPDWLLESKYISIIDHKDIFPDKSVLPVFNSHAIEACLHHIKGLSEHYLYLNDDIIFGRSVNVSQFFPKKGKISIFPSNQTFIPFGKISKSMLPVDSAAINTRTLLEREEIGYAIYKFKHTPLPQIKSILFEIENKFTPEIEHTRQSRFRQPSDISITSSLLFNYSYFKNIAEKNLIKYSYINLSSADYLSKLTKVTTNAEGTRPDVFCINDVEGDVDDIDVEKNFINTMNHFLPIKSKFEV